MAYDLKLEKAIDSVGRERVFDRAASLGWSASCWVPKYVWWGIVAELRPMPTLQELKTRLRELNRRLAEHGR